MQRDLVERAMAGDHDAFSELARVSIGRLYVVARLILRDDGRAEDATQEALAGRLAAPLRPARSRPLRGMAPSPAGQRVLSRSAPRPTAGEHRGPCRPARDAGSAGSDRRGLRSRRSRSARARLPTPRCRSANGARACTTTSGSASTMRRRSSASRRGPSARGSIARSTRCAPPSRPMPEPPCSTKDGRHDVAERVDATTSTGS